MPASGELLFGKIALSEGFCTQAQIEECTRLQLQLQSPHQPAPRLGDLLMERGYLTPDQHVRILEIQRQNLDLVDPLVKKKKESVIFGKLAIKQGFVTADEVNQCLRLQAEPGEARSLGEILVSKGFLTAIQVKEILNKQLKKIMSCPACKTACWLTCANPRRGFPRVACASVLVSSNAPFPPSIASNLGISPSI